MCGRVGGNLVPHTSLHFLIISERWQFFRGGIIQCTAYPSCQHSGRVQNRQFFDSGFAVAKMDVKTKSDEFLFIQINTTVTIFTCVSPFIRQQDFRLDALDWQGLYIFMQTYSFYFQYRINIPNPWIKALQYVGRHVGRYYICVM